jgi:hypothetical protein
VGVDPTELFWSYRGYVLAPGLEVLTVLLRLIFTCSLEEIEHTDSMLFRAAFGRNLRVASAAAATAGLVHRSLRPPAIPPQFRGAC